MSSLCMVEQSTGVVPCKEQTVSILQAEYQAAALATREVLWLWTLSSDLGHGLRDPLLIWCDINGALALPLINARSEHVEIQHHFARESVQLGYVKFEYCKIGYDC
jgi:hypothetical protein